MTARMRFRSLALAAAFALAACQAPPSRQAPTLTVTTITADLPDPQGLAATSDGLVLTSSRGILRMSADDPLSTVSAGPPLQDPAGLDWHDDLLLVADPPSNRIWTLPSSTGSLQPFAGTGTSLFPLGDAGPATSAQLNSPHDLEIGPDGTVYIADTGNGRVRRVGADGRIATLPGTEEAFQRPTALALADDGSLLVVDGEKGELSRVSPDGTLTTLARDLDRPQGVIASGMGVLVSESGKNRVVWVGPEGRVTPVVGGGSSQAESGPGTAIALSHPSHLAQGPQGIYLLDGNRVLLLTPQATP